MTFAFIYYVKQKRIKESISLSALLNNDNENLNLQTQFGISDSVEINEKKDIIKDQSSLSARSDNKSNGELNNEIQLKEILCD